MDAGPARNEFRFDWTNARILLREATAQIDPVSPASPSAK